METRRAMALLFLVISIVAAIFCFGGVATVLAGIAHILFIVEIAMFVWLRVAGLMSGSALWQQ